MTAELAKLDASAASTSIYEIAAEVGDPLVCETAYSLWHPALPAPDQQPPESDVDVDPWAQACCCCGDDDGEGLQAADGRFESLAPLIVVVSPLMAEDWSDPLSAEEVVFGVRAKRRRGRVRPLEPVWIC